MKNISIWEDNIMEKDYLELTDNKKVDVLIIGGGMTGISTLYHLSKSNYKIILCEQNKIGRAVTGKSTGKLSYLQNDLIDKIRNSFDDSMALKYINSQKEAIKMIVDTINKEKIDCDLEKVDSYIYTNKDKEVEKVINLEKFLNGVGIKTDRDKCSLVENKYMFKVSDTYMFNPLKFLYGLLDSNYEIYENSSIIKIEKKDDYYLCYTDRNKIECKYVVLASHYPYFSVPYLFPLKGSLEKSYISASKYNTSSISLISYSNPFISIRTYKDYLIYLSNSKAVSDDINDLDNFRELNKKIKDINLKPDYLWSNIDIITNDGLPYVGKIKDNLYIGTGYNTWGLTNGFLSGKIISDMILGKENEYNKLFDPKRINFSQIVGALSDSISSLTGYINGLFTKNGDIEYKIFDGKVVMAYKNGGKEYLVYHSCPHMGCGLLFNEVEKTFDCPCHGSRFDLSGKCISGPSNRDITFKGIDR